MVGFRLLCVTLFLCLLPLVISAQEQQNTKKANVDQSSKKNADIVPQKRAISEKDIARKKEDWYLTGLPLLNFDPVGGVGYGLRVIFFENGTKDNALFDYSPYFHRLYGQAFFTTGGRHFHTLNWDAPYFFRLFSKWFRVRSELNYDDDPTINYYGVGDETARPVHFVSSDGQTTRSIQKVDDFQTYIDGFGNSQGNTAARYNKVRLLRPTWILSTESDIYYAWGGAVRLTFGLNIQYVNVTDYTNSKFEVAGENRDGEYTQVDTKLRQDFNAGRIYGVGDSWNNSVKFAISFDNRDFEPDPNRGTFTDFTMEFIPEALGSRLGYSRYNLTSRLYYDPIPGYEDFVIAARGSYHFVIGDRAPFYAQGEVLYSDVLHTSGGGFRALRGYLARRFAGKANALFNLELRWTFWNFPAAFGQQFSLVLVPFIDVGRAFESVALTNAKDWGLSYGGGLRIAWNQATIIFFDYGFSVEGRNFYLNFNHIF